MKKARFVPFFISDHMYKIAITFFLLLNLSSFAQEDKEGAFLTLSTSTIDYKIIKKGTDGQRKLKISNTGNQPLIINNCDGSCGCTVPTCPEKPILPGKSAFIFVKYDTSRVGPFSKTVTIKSNAINHTVYVKIEGTVKE